MARTRPRRDGLTLLELMLVLAVLLAVAALASPILRRTFSAQTLKAAADEVRAAFSQARVRAIRSGNVHAFLYEPGSNRYTLVPFINSYSLINPQLAAAAAAEPPLQKLPADLLFAGGTVADDARGQFETETAVTPTGGMTPILFYPDGTAQDAIVHLRDSRGSQVSVVLRGLTGLASVARTASEP